MIILAWVLSIVLAFIGGLVTTMVLLNAQYGEDWQCVLKKENGDCECDK